MDELSFRLESFEGPLDLLLKLISKNKVDICDIPIALIFEQYMEYVTAMQQLDMDIASEFVTMASELMLIKSKMLLPRHDEDEEDPRAKLAAALLEYKRMKDAAVQLQEGYVHYHGRMTKDTDEIPPETAELVDQQVELLEKAFGRLLSSYRERKLTEKEPEKTFQQLLRRKITPVPQRIFSIMRHLYKYGATDFDHLMLLAPERSDLIASFLAILELVKAQRLLLSETEEEMIILALNPVHNRTQPPVGVTVAD